MVCKRSLLVLLSAVMCLCLFACAGTSAPNSSAASTTAAPQGTTLPATIVITGPKLSELPEAELLQMMIDAKVTFPAGPPSSQNIQGMREFLAALEENPNHRAPMVSWGKLEQMYKDLRALFNEYYGIEN